MDRDQFLSLPTGVALGILYDQMPQRMATVPVPQVPRAPKFDNRISRKGGFCWMSEMDLSGLRYWHGKKSEGGGDPKYAEKDAKTVSQLAYWIAYRTADPTSAWHGERNRQPTRAAAPSSQPQIHPWEPRNDAPALTSATDDDYGGGEAVDTYNF